MLAPKGPAFMAGGTAALAAAVYTVCALWASWPLVLDLDSRVYLYPTEPSPAGDLAGSIAHLRELVEGRHNPFGPGTVRDFAAPEGLPVRWSLNVASFSSTAFLYVSAAIVGANAAYGLFAITGYVASGMAMFLLIRWVTGQPWVAVVVGWAFAFYPFALVKGEHPHFIHGWVFVVLAWRMLVLAERPTIRNGVLAGTAAVLALSWTHYFLLLGGVAYAVFAPIVLIVGLLRPGSRGRALVSNGLAAVIVAGFVLSVRAVLESSGDDSTLPFNLPVHLDETAAEPFMYLVPAVHTLGGRWFGDVRAEHGLLAVEWTLYLGVSMLVLAATGLAATVLRRRGRGAVAGVAGVAVLIVALAFSGPTTTTLFGHAVHLPAHYVYELEPGFRLYTRFVVVAMLGVCLLAGIGLSAVVDMLGRPARVLALGAAAVIVPLDLWNRPARPTHRIETPSIYKSIRDHPRGILAEYPLRPIGATGHYMDLYFQDAHGNPILNGYYLGSAERRARAVADLADSRTAGWLATLGVRYVLLAGHSLSPPGSQPVTFGGGFRAIERDASGALYVVTNPPRPLVFHRDGFWGPEGSGATRYQWAGAPPVRLQIVAPCRRCEGTLTFTVESFDRVRTVRVNQAGRRVFFFVATPRKERVEIPLRFERATALEFAINPGPQSIAETIESADFRRISISIQNPEFDLAP